MGPDTVDRGMIMTKQTHLWIRSILAAVISGFAGGVITGFAAIGVDPQHFNMAAGFSETLKIAGISAVFHAILGVAMFLQKSPLPEEENPEVPKDHVA